MFETDPDMRVFDVTLHFPRPRRFTDEQLIKLRQAMPYARRARVTAEELPGADAPDDRDDYIIFTAAVTARTAPDALMSLGNEARAAFKRVYRLRRSQRPHIDHARAVRRA